MAENPLFRVRIMPTPGAGNAHRRYPGRNGLQNAPPAGLSDGLDAELRALRAIGRPMANGRDAQVHARIVLAAYFGRGRTVEQRRADAQPETAVW